ncbi:hypothetical protein L1987_87127 [Smallanthus sonchifolius]|nr:hypothetical protein L1987_87127 [Smallanthus sonchifolius]
MSILTCFFLALIPYAASITFNFTNISPKNSKDIIFSGDAAYSSYDGIQVTHERNSDEYGSLWLAGRATYIKLLHLWDDDSSDQASFSTSFTFVIDSYPNKNYADGLTFFLAQNNSVINAGGPMGLPIDPATQTSKHRFVAVEFDTYSGNDWDPIDPDTNSSIGDHVGININSITSIAYKKWYSNITYGKECRALISYYSDSKNLSVSFTGFINNSPVWETGLHYTIDLKLVLPEWVIFGFSASTGNRFQKNNVISWAFNSTVFKVHGNNRKNNMLLKMGLTTGMLVLVSGLAIFAYFLWRRKKNDSDKGEELGLLEMNVELEMGASMPRRFSYQELARSTANFSETEKLACGRKAIDNKAQEKQVRLLEWVWELYGNGALLEAIGPNLGSEFEEEEIRRLMIIGLSCVHPDFEHRPSMREAIKVLNSEASMPLLPSKMPMASYFTPPKFVAVPSFLEGKFHWALFGLPMLPLGFPLLDH